MDTKEQEQEERLRNVCKHAVRECLQGARFMNYREASQIEHFAATEYDKADFDKPDRETFKQTYMKAYTKAQELLIGKPSPFSMQVYPSQIAQHMLWEEKMHENSDAAYAVISEKVEAAAIPQQEEVLP